MHVSADPDRLVPPAETLDQEVEVSLDTQAGNTLEHEKSIDGNTAYCRQISHGLVDCQACLMARCSALLQESDPEQAEIIQRVLEVLQNAASSGLAKEQLSVCLLRVQGRYALIRPRKMWITHREHLSSLLWIV